MVLATVIYICLFVVLLFVRLKLDEGLACEGRVGFVQTSNVGSLWSSPWEQAKQKPT